MAPLCEAVLVSQQPLGAAPRARGKEKVRSVPNPNAPNLDRSATCGERGCLSSEDTAEDMAR